MSSQLGIVLTRQANKDVFTHRIQNSEHALISLMMTEKQQLQASLATIDKKVTSALHSRLSTIQSNDVNITSQTKSLHRRTQEARKQQDNWNHVVKVGRNGMKVSSLFTCFN